MASFTTIPFNAESGLWKYNGVAKFSAAGIVLEFESKLIGLVSDGVKEARIAMDDIFDIKFRKGMFKRGARIEVRLRSIAALNGLPNQDGKIKLKVLHDDFDLARDTVERFRKTLAEHADALPPVHTPVSALFDESEETTRELKQIDQK
jgi:hypothetical protein